jgi:hypothetical protein
MLAVGLLSGGASAGGANRSQSTRSNDACVNAWAWSVASYRVDWTSYYDVDTLTTYYGYVANASNTPGSTLEGVTVFASPADLVGGGNTDPKPPVATVALDTDALTGLPLGAIGFYGKSQLATADLGPVEGQGYPLETYNGTKALGSYTVCYGGR